MTVDPQCRPVKNALAASRAFDDEMVVIDPAVKVARMFNSAGSRIWELADGERSVAAIAAELEIEYAVSTSEALSEVTRFVEELERRGLLTLAMP